MSLFSFIKKLISSGPWTEVPGIHNVGIYTYKELGHATNDFSPANKIGEGGFGSVYKVITG